MEIKQLVKGDWVKTDQGIGVIQYFGEFNGNRWRRCTRKRANGAWIYFPSRNIDGYVHRVHILKYLCAPPPGFYYKENGDIAKKTGEIIYD